MAAREPADPPNPKHGSPDTDGLYRMQVREHEHFAMFLLDVNGRITSWNRGVETVFGYTEEEWVGRDALIIFTEEDRAAGIPETEIRIAQEQGHATNIRWHVRNDGTRIYTIGILKSLRDSDGNLLGYSKIALDDTPRKRLEDALTQSNADLQQFAFVASHDIQEPLRTIVNFSDLLQRRYADRLDEEANEFLRLIANASQRMTTLIRDLLAYSQITQEENQVTSVHLDQDLDAAISLLQTSITETGAVITHAPLPTASVNRGEMVRLFQNLIGNSIKFRKPSEAPRIHISGESTDHSYIVRVQDNGIGFPPEHAQAIFAPFKRLHSAQEYPGTGVGLAACKRIVERFGGQIGAESEPGSGATFWFTIPQDRLRQTG